MPFAALALKYAAHASLTLALPMLHTAKPQQLHA